MQLTHFYESLSKAANYYVHQQGEVAANDSKQRIANSATA
jgi:hypothetical protein